MKCAYATKGCDWDGTVAMLQKHHNTCAFQNGPVHLPSTVGGKSHAQCYIFIDDSNLWVVGKKAQGKKLIDASADSRYRIDFGKFLDLVTNGRHLSKAFLYSAVPPPNDSVWKAGREKNFTVKTFQCFGKDQVNVAMTSDIVASLCTETKKNVTFITVPGGNALAIPIKMVLDKGVPVELWSWEDAMAREFRQLAKTHPLFTANCLDSVQQPFSFTAFMSSHDKKGINPAHAIVYREVPRGNRFLCELAGYINRLMRFFFITSVECQASRKRDLIIEFPNSHPDVVLQQLKKLGDFGYQPCSYPEYAHGRTRQHFQIETKNRFQAFGDIEIDNDSLLDAVESSMSLEMDEISSDQGSSTEASDNWATELRRKVKNTARRREMLCRWGDHCAMGSECPYLHTKAEMRLFTRFRIYSLSS